eukprot:m.21930 g.21930  ORF g.21930 m.21930 type:complete len:99 (+) comp3943_c0_seq1:671-967(+)
MSWQVLMRWTQDQKKGQVATYASLCTCQRRCECWDGHRGATARRGQRHAYGPQTAQHGSTCGSATVRQLLHNGVDGSDAGAVTSALQGHSQSDTVVVR